MGEGVQRDAAGDMTIEKLLRPPLLPRGDTASPLQRQRGNVAVFAGDVNRQRQSDVVDEYPGSFLRPRGEGRAHRQKQIPGATGSRTVTPGE